MACGHHELKWSILVDRVAPNDEAGARDEIAGFFATLRCACSECGERFGFRTAGNTGVDPAKPATSRSTKKIVLPLVTPSELALLGPEGAQAPAFRGAKVRLRKSPP